MENDRNMLTDMKSFWVVWVGQVISVLGSGLTSFALGVWIYERTGQATPFAINALVATLPGVLLMPIAGSLADRANRRRIMILADTASAGVTAIAAALFLFGSLQVWHVYLISLMGAVCSSFQRPAYMASIAMLVPKKDLARAGGLMQMGDAIQTILTPVLAGALYGLLGLGGVFLIDAATFFLAAGALLIVHIPQPERTTGHAAPQPPGSPGGLLADAALGWRYLWMRPGLLGLLLYFASVNFFLSFSGVLIAPLILSLGSPAQLGMVQMAGGLAMLAGGAIMGAWGGPRRRVPWLIGFIAAASLGYLVSGLGTSAPVIACGQFLVLFFIPFAAALSQAVFQTKVPPALQGRVFAIRAMIAYSMMPLAYLLAGPLADQVFEPLLAAGGGLSQTQLGVRLGAAPGRGIGLMFIVSSLFLWAESLFALALPRIRLVEDELSDAIPDETAGTPSPPAGAMVGDEVPGDAFSPMLAD